MESKRKAEAVGRLLLSAREIDSVRKDNFKLQKILGKQLYYQIGDKWYYNIEKLRKKTIAELNELTEKIKTAVK